MLTARIAEVVPGRVELPTSTLSVWRSNQLSYRTGGVSSKLVPFGPASFFLAISFISIKLIAKRRQKISNLRQISPLLPLLFSSPSPILSLSERSRKEVFQPHLPVRLPCYDLAPITSFTLGRPSRSQLSGTPGFHGLTGGVYKARERIHRAMADARLLANPASWSRVADSSPN